MEGCARIWPNHDRVCGWPCVDRMMSLGPDAQSISAAAVTMPQKARGEIQIRAGRTRAARILEPWAGLAYTVGMNVKHFWYGNPTLRRLPSGTAAAAAELSAGG